MAKVIAYGSPAVGAVREEAAPTMASWSYSDYNGWDSRSEVQPSLVEIAGLRMMTAAPPAFPAMPATRMGAPAGTALQVTGTPMSSAATMQRPAVLARRRGRQMVARKPSNARATTHG